MQNWVAKDIRLIFLQPQLLPQHPHPHTLKKNHHQHPYLHPYEVYQGLVAQLGLIKFERYTSSVKLTPTF